MPGRPSDGLDGEGVSTPWIRVWSAAMLVDAEEVAGGILEVGGDLAGGGVDRFDDLAAAGGDEGGGVGGVVDHDGDDDAGLGGGSAVEDPHSADFVDAVVKGDAAIAVDAYGPSEDGGVEGGGDGDVRGGNFEVADFAVAECGRHVTPFGEVYCKLMAG